MADDSYLGILRRMKVLFDTVGSLEVKDNPIYPNTVDIIMKDLCGRSMMIFDSSDIEGEYPVAMAVGTGKDIEYAAKDMVVKMLGKKLCGFRFTEDDMDEYSQFDIPSSVQKLRLMIDIFNSGLQDQTVMLEYEHKRN